MTIDGGVSNVNPENPIIPNLENIPPPTDAFRTRKFTNIGGKVKESLGSASGVKETGALALKKSQSLISAIMKFKNSPNTKSSKKEKCYWIAALCFIVAAALFLAISITMGNPAGVLMALNLAGFPLGGGLFLVSLGRHEAIKEKKLKEWKMPKLKTFPPGTKDPEAFKRDAEIKWRARNTEKNNMDTNQKRITELKTELKNPKLTKETQEKIQTEIEKRTQDKIEIFKNFENAAVEYWSFTNPEKGAELKERFNTAREVRGEKDLFEIARMEDLFRTEEKEDLPAG